MTPLHPLLLLLLLTTTATAQQNTTGNGSSQSSDAAFNTKFNPLTAVIVVVLIGVFFFATFIYIFFRKYSTTIQQTSGVPTGRSRSKVAAKGLDPAIIATFPTLIYSDVKGLKMGKSPLECAVCLCEFHDDEELMLLPKCSHAFHVDCIGMWLSAHNTCPVCRANLDPPPAPAASDTTGEIVEEEPAPVEHVAVTVDEEPSAQVEMVRSGSKRGKVFAKWRSRSARPELGARMGQYWAEDDRERFTLRLPESVKAELMAGKLSRSRSVTAFPVGFGKGEGSSRSRRGYFGGLDGSAARSYRMGRWDRAAKSDKWGFLMRSGSSRKGGGGGGGGGGGEREGSAKSGKWGFLMRSGSSRKGGVAAAGVGGGRGGGAAAVGGSEEGSVKPDRWAFLRSGSSRKGGGGEDGSSRGKVLIAMKGPLDQCLGGGGGSSSKGADGKDDDEASTVALNSV